MVESAPRTRPRRILLLYPEFPPTYWGLQYSLPVLGKRSFMPPLGLLTVAALCPPGYDFRLADLNCGPLRDEDLAWADVVCMSAMLTQKHSLAAAARRCRAAGKLVVLGGPYPTSCPEECLAHGDVVVEGEAEDVWAEVLADLERGAPRARYRAAERPDVETSPTPRFDLIRPEDYFTIPIQFSRGCPFQCEFCDIIVMFGRRPRTKRPAQIRAELDAVLATGYRGDVFFVDDNFIGNKKKTLTLLETLQAWNAERGHPFEYDTEASVDLAQRAELLQGMVDAGFRRVFLGIESPSAASLQETKKLQNLRESIESSVDAIARAGLNVMAGFIVGFDSDPPEIHDLQIDLIGRLPIPLAMVARLEAAPGTPLWERMEADGRLLKEEDGFIPGRVGHTNIVPLGSPEEALRGYRRVLEAIYAPEAYFARVLDANRRAPRPASRWEGLRTALRQLRTMARSSTGGLGPVLRFFTRLRPAFRREALRLFWRLLRERPDRLGLYLGYLVVGHHMHEFTYGLVLGQIDDQLRELAERAPDRGRAAPTAGPAPEARRLPVATG